MTIKEWRLKNLNKVEIAYCEAIDKECSKTKFYNATSVSTYGGSFMWTRKYQKLSDQLHRYRKHFKCN